MRNDAGGLAKRPLMSNHIASIFKAMAWWFRNYKLKCVTDILLLNLIVVSLPF